MNNDPISDMLTRIRNANSTKAVSVEMPYSNNRGAIARLLKREGFIQDFAVEGKGVSKILRVYLKYGPGKDKAPVIRGLKRVSKPGLRRYVGAKSLKPILSGTGIAVLSTSRGMMTDREARKANMGGEWVCSVW